MKKLLFLFLTGTIASCAPLNPYYRAHGMELVSTSYFDASRDRNEFAIVNERIAVGRVNEFKINLPDSIDQGMAVVDVILTEDSENKFKVQLVAVMIVDDRKGIVEDYDRYSTANKSLTKSPAKYDYYLQVIEPYIREAKFMNKSSDKKTVCRFFFNKYPFIIYTG